MDFDAALDESGIVFLHWAIVAASYFLANSLAEMTRYSRSDWNKPAGINEKALVYSCAVAVVFVLAWGLTFVAFPQRLSSSWPTPLIVMLIPALLGIWAFYKSDLLRTESERKKARLKSEAARRSAQRGHD